MPTPTFAPLSNNIPTPKVEDDCQIAARLVIPPESADPELVSAEQYTLPLASVVNFPPLLYVEQFWPLNLKLEAMAAEDPSPTFPVAFKVFRLESPVTFSPEVESKLLVIEEPTPKLPDILAEEPTPRNPEI